MCSNVVNSHTHLIYTLGRLLSPDAGSADALRAEVMQSSWYDAFRSDMRSSVVVRAVEGSLGQLGRATQAASSWTSSYITFTGQGIK